MSVPAARIRTSSGWRDIAIQGAPGIPGFTPSAKYRSPAFAMAAADAYARVYTPAGGTVDYNDLGGNPFSGGYFLCPTTGKYLLGFMLGDVAQGTVQIAMMINDVTVPRRITFGTATGSDGSKGGIEIWDILSLAAGNTVKLVAFDTGGGNTNILTIEAIRLDASALLPSVLVGAPIPWLVSAIPSGYLEFDGQAITQAAYPQLYALFGANLPDLRGRTLIGQGGSVGAAVGAVGGASTHTLSEAEMPSHSHGVPDGSNFYTTAGANWFFAAGGSTLQYAHTTTANKGGGGAHNNMQPYRAVRWITVAG